MLYVCIIHNKNDEAFIFSRQQLYCIGSHSIKQVHACTHFQLLYQKITLSGKYAAPNINGCAMASQHAMKLQLHLNRTAVLTNNNTGGSIIMHH